MKIKMKEQKGSTFLILLTAIAVIASVTTVVGIFLIHPQNKNQTGQTICDVMYNGNHELLCKDYIIAYNGDVGYLRIDEWWDASPTNHTHHTNEIDIYGSYSIETLNNSIINLPK